MKMSRNVWCVLLACLLSACATSVKPKMPTAESTQEWSGRISLQVQSEPPQQLNASFGLQGGPNKGQLDVFSPLGTTLASLQWTSQEAVLQQGQQQQRFASIADLTERLTGTQLPMRELFDWLNGHPTAVAGWQTDVSQLSSGWLFATRTSPAPAVSLKIKLDDGKP
jgi:outer membrane lipoprotein LolB